MRDKKDWDTADDRDDAIAILELCWAVLDKYTGGELGNYAHTVEKDLRNEWEWHGMDKVTDALSAARGKCPEPTAGDREAAERICDEWFDNPFDVPLIDKIATALSAAREKGYEKGVKIYKAPAKDLQKHLNAYVKMYNEKKTEVEALAVKAREARDSIRKAIDLRRSGDKGLAVYADEETRRARNILNAAILEVKNHG